jgi:hypothetical protein
MTPHQTRTLERVRRTSLVGCTGPARIVVYLQGIDGGPAAIIMPDGEYRMIRGWRRRVAA